MTAEVPISVESSAVTAHQKVTSVAAVRVFTAKEHVADSTYKPRPHFSGRRDSLNLTLVVGA